MVRGALVRAFATTRAHVLHPERPLAELPHAKVPVAMADAALRSAAEREWYVANRMVEDKVPWELGDRRRLERKHDRPSTLAEFGAKWGWLAEGRRGGRMRWREVPAVCSRGGRPSRAREGRSERRETIVLWVRDVTSQSRVSRLGSVGASGVRRKALIALGYEKENVRSSPDADDKAAFARAAHRPVAASRLGRTGRGALERARRHRVRSPRDGLGTSGDVRSTRRRARRRAARRRGTRDAAGGDAEGESHRRDGAKRADRSRSASRCGARRRTLEEDTGGSRCTRDLDYSRGSATTRPDGV